MNRLLRRLARATRLSLGDVITFGLLVALLLTVAGAVAASGWFEGLAPLALVSVLSVLAGMFLAKSVFAELTALVISSVYGGALISWMAAGALAPEVPLPQRYLQLVERLLRWVVAVLNGYPNQDRLVFSFFIATLFWYLGHNAAWHTFRLDRITRVIILPGVVLVVNAFFYEGPLQLDAFLLVYSIWALLLMVRAHLHEREYAWRRYRVPILTLGGMAEARVPRGRPVVGLFRAGLTLAVLVVMLVAALPTIDADALDRFQERWLDEPLASLQTWWDELTGSLSNGYSSAGYYDEETLPLGGPVRLGDADVMYVRPDEPLNHRFYWRARVYDVYDGAQWRASGDEWYTVPAGETIEKAQFWEQQQHILRFSWASETSSTLLYVVQQPLLIGLATEVQRIMEGGEPVGTLSAVPKRPLHTGDYYDVLALISYASPARLRSATREYPAWIGRYFQLPDSVTQRTRDLALNIVNQAGAVTPYGQALAVEAWLRANFTYNETVSVPPEGRDFVDWVLFDLRQGYCTYYASSMVVMLRTLGVPARMAGGFSEGVWDEAGQRFTVRERNAHAWVEVFFPGYGWIEFEPTAGRALPIRSAPETPTSTPTPAITVVPGAGALLPTLSPVPSPTPTLLSAASTPTPPAALPPVEGGTGSSGAAFLRELLKLMLAGMVLLVVLPLGALALWWWVEERGMGGFSPARKAYARLWVYGRWLGVRPHVWETPAERGRRMVDAAPRAGRFVYQITEWYSFERYRRTRPARARQIRRVWAKTRPALIRQMLRRRFPRLARWWESLARLL